MTIFLPLVNESSRKYPQQTTSGLVTLLFCLILLTSATTLVFTMARTSQAEQRIIGNEYHAESLRQACEAGLHYGFAWIRQYKLEWYLTNEGQYKLDIPLPTDNLGIDKNIRLKINAVSDNINSAFFQLQAQAGYTTATTTSNHYKVRQFVYYTANATPQNTTNTIASVIAVPGTWYDFN